MSTAARTTTHTRRVGRDLIAASIIASRELHHLFRRPARVVATIGTPLLIWLFLAAGFAESIRSDVLASSDYRVFLLPGMMTLVAVFASVFVSISVIEDRQTGWLRTVLVSPASRWSIALGKVAGGTIVGFAQAAALLLVLPVVGADVAGAGNLLLALVALLLTCLAMTALGLALAWSCESTASFHSVMNLLLMPMWLLSGAFFPLEGTAGWLRVIMLINPLTWCRLAIAEPLMGADSGLITQNGISFIPLMITAAFALLTWAAAIIVISAPRKRQA